MSLTVAPEDVDFFQYQFLVENSLDGVLLTDTNGRILYANAAACALLGASEAELCTLDRQRLSDPRDPGWADAVSERQRNGRPRFIGSMLRLDGTAFLAEITSTTFTDRAGELRSSFVFRDVSEAVRIRQRYQALNVISQALLAGRGIGDVLNLIALEARKLVNSSDVAVISSVPPQGVQVVVAQGPAMSEMIGYRYHAESRVAKFMSSRSAFIVDELSAVVSFEEGRLLQGRAMFVPITAGERVFGNLLIRTEPSSPPYTDNELAAVDVFARSVALALAVGEARAEFETTHLLTAQQLQRALDDRSVIEQAKGYVSASHGVSVASAFERLRHYARSHNSTVREIATDVLARRVVV